MRLKKKRRFFTISIILLFAVIGLGFISWKYIERIDDLQEQVDKLEKISSSYVLPCPFCGSYETEIEERYGIYGIDCDVACNHCGAIGPMFKGEDKKWLTKEEAILEWNKLPREKEEE